MSGSAESSPTVNLHTYIDRFKLASIELAKSLPSEPNSTLRQILPELFNDYFQAVNNSNIHLRGYGNADTWLEIYKSANNYYYLVTTSSIYLTGL